MRNSVKRRGVCRINHDMLCCLQRKGEEMTLLEVCCYSMACAQEAQRCGADRIELCAAPHEGGLTPSLGVLKTVRETVTIPVHPIIRPRGGDFCYTESEFAAMLDDVATVRELGFPGVVIGVLDGWSGRYRAHAKIMAAAGSLAVTFHRAFDMCADPRQAYRTLADSGVARILTSGQQASAEKGLSLITELIALGDTPIIMAGAGVRAANLAKFLQAGVKRSTARPATGCHRQCAFVIPDCRCPPMPTQMNIRAMPLMA
jgi:copper homeostasis protein